MATQVHRLGRAWEKYKRMQAGAHDELHRSNQYQSKAIRTYRFGQAVTIDQQAREYWTGAVHTIIGPEAEIKWIGSAKHPACLINNVLMFS
jgi:hypothetical protein